VNEYRPGDDPPAPPEDDTPPEGEDSWADETPAASEAGSQAGREDSWADDKAGVTADTHAEGDDGWQADDPETPDDPETGHKADQDRQGQDADQGRRRTVEKPESPIWNQLKPYRGELRTNGESGKDRRMYRWDYSHKDIETYDRRGKHLGDIDPVTGDETKPAKKGRFNKYVR